MSNHTSATITVGDAITQLGNVICELGPKRRLRRTVTALQNQIIEGGRKKKKPPAPLNNLLKFQTVKKEIA